MGDVRWEQPSRRQTRRGTATKMPPPPPPPGAPPPPAKAAFVPPKAKKGGGGGADRGALLQSIQKGKALKKTVTNDRSSPLVGKTSNAPAPGGGGSGGPSRLGGGGGGGGGGGASQENGGHPLPGIGGLFGEGFPKLRSAGQSGAGTSARKPFKVPSSSNQGDKTRNKMFSSKDTSWDQPKSLVYVKSPKMTIVGTIWVLCKHLDLVSSTCNKVGKT